MFFQRKITGNFYYALTFFISLFISSATLHAEEDLFEPNNSVETASRIIVDDNETQFHQFVSADDEDWMYFYTDGNKPYTIEIPDGSVGINANPVISLFNESGKILIDNFSIGFEGEGETIDWNSTAEGFYFIRITNAVNSDTSTDTQYQIQVFNPFAPLNGIIIGKLRDLCTNNLVLSKTTVFTETEKSTARNGEYDLSVKPDNYTVTVNADGYQSQSKSATVEDRDKAIVNFELTPIQNCEPTPPPADNLTAIYDDTKGLITIYDLLAYGVHYEIELQDQGNLQFTVSSIKPIANSTGLLPASYDVTPLKLIIPRLLAFGTVYAVTLVNTGEFLFAVESAQ